MRCEQVAHLDPALWMSITIVRLLPTTASSSSGALRTMRKAFSSSAYSSSSDEVALSWPHAGAAIEANNSSAANAKLIELPLILLVAAETYASACRPHRWTSNRLSDPPTLLRRRSECECLFTCTAYRPLESSSDLGYWPAFRGSNFRVSPDVMPLLEGAVTQ